MSGVKLCDEPSYEERDLGLSRRNYVSKDTKKGRTSLEMEHEESMPKSSVGREKGNASKPLCNFKVSGSHMKKGKEKQVKLILLIRYTDNILYLNQNIWNI